MTKDKSGNAKELNSGYLLVKRRFRKKYLCKWERAVSIKSMQWIQMRNQLGLCRSL